MVNWLVLSAVSTLLSGEPRPEANVDTYIRALNPEQRLEFIIKYAASAETYAGFLKFRQPPRIYIHCQSDGCDPKLPHILADLRSRVPGAYGSVVAEPETAQIEIYVAAEPADFDRRDRQVDKELHIDAQIGAKFLFPPQPAPCRATIYFEQQTWTIEKTMIFIDSDASPRMQYLCMGFELTRAIGVLTVPVPLFYQKLAKRPSDDPLPYLAANVLLHTSAEIQAGDSTDKALAVLKDRYGVQ
ncbi:MAG: hypothetical protein AB7F09_02675 [Parvibaculaceae bacterium]